MANDCFCGDAPRSLGSPDCVTIEKQIEKFALTTLKDDAGDEKRILKTDLTKANFDTLINEPQPRDRVYMTAPTKSPESTRDDSVFEDFDDGTSFFVRENPMTMIAPFPGQSRVYLDNLKSWKCQDFGYYALDKVGNILYLDKGDEYAYPIPVDKDTQDFKYMTASGSTVAKAWWRHQWPVTISDNCLIAAPTDISPNDLQPLLPVSATFSNESTTGFTVELTASEDSSVKIEELVFPGNFVLKNVTQDTTVAITTVTESSPGVYEFVFPAQASADVLRLTISQTGFDFYFISQTDITIP